MPARKATTRKTSTLPKKNAIQSKAEGRDIVVIGGSAGSVEAVVSLLPQLPHDLPASVFIVYHLGTERSTAFDKVLNDLSPLQVKYAQDNESIRPQTVYLAVPDHHLIVPDGCVRLVKGPRENRARPAIDTLFRSAAVAHGSRVIGVILSGTLDDGAAGLAAVKQCGGITIVQNPEDALFPEMPRNALAYTEVDHIVTLAELGALLTQLTQEPAPTSPPVPEYLQRENAFLNSEPMRKPSPDDMPGKLTMLVCPECGGSLWELPGGKAGRYRCHTGHAYSEKTLLSEQADTVERALWSAVRTLEEQAKLFAKMAADAHDGKRAVTARRFRDREREATEEAKAIRALIMKR